VDRSFYRFVTIHACDRRTDGRTDGRTEFSSLDRVCIACSAVKTVCVAGSECIQRNDRVCCLQLQHADQASSSVITAAVSQHVGSAMETMTAEICQTKGTAVYPLPHQVDGVTMCFDF